MSIEIIDKIKQKNAQKFKLMDSYDIDWSQDATVPLSNIIDEADNVRLSEKLGNNNTLPILDPSMIEQMEAKGIPLPKDYLAIPNVDQTQPFEDVDPSTDKTYIDIMFSAIRALQAEVAKLRNSFKYGMYSYTDTKTAMGAVEREYIDLSANEPLWAIDEQELSPIEGAVVQIGEGHSLKPVENVIASDGELSITLAGASWKDQTEETDSCFANPDAKQYLYLTTSNMNLSADFVNVNNATRKLTLDFTKLGVPVSSSEKYNILIAVSRAFYDKTTDQYYGPNFIWLTVASYGTLSKKIEGYWNPEEPLDPYGHYILHDDIQPIGDETKPSESRYYFDETKFSGVKLFKFDMYSKYQDFSSSVQPSTPSDEDYKYEVAHITIRSVASEDVIKAIVKQLPVNELIYNKENNGLYIVSDVGKYKKISGSGGGGEEGMTKQETIDWLEQNGIHVKETGDGSVEIDDLHLGQITFINEDTGKSYRFTCTPDGKLRSELLGGLTLASRLSAVGFDFTDEFSKSGVRGFVGNFTTAEAVESGKISKPAQATDFGLHSDRIKIGSIYAPQADRKSYACTHAYVELENTSTTDFQLDGCFLHYARQKPQAGTYVYNTYEKSFPLKGVIPAGGTFLIRGKQYADPSSSNCVIDVSEYDMEWYVENEAGQKELIDFTLWDNNSWMLTYGSTKDEAAITHNTIMIEARPSTDEYYDSGNSVRKYSDRLIDVALVGSTVYADNVNPPVKSWGNEMKKCFIIPANGSDCIYKNMFELDPAKQAYQSLVSYDSSRIRNDSDNDLQSLVLTKDKIEFPKTEETYDITKFTPRASFSKKNVSTDKTSLDFDRPNMVTCAFGIDMHKTRCFNWISTGIFDEFLWIRPKNSADGKWCRFESYRSDAAEKDDVKSLTADGVTFNFQKRSYADAVKQAIYSRLNDKSLNTFPGCNVNYTAHKCIVSVARTTGDHYVENPTVFEYVVGRMDKNGNPDAEHTSDIKTFTLYPTTFIPRIFQITDQQGFHWIEYQAWAAAAEELNKTINAELEDDPGFFPVLINTGDMTQNGTRVNEWLDYYNAGRHLFDHLEQMNVVGNNDLCNTDPTILGTGDDPGKSNGYYFHVFYCYEVDDSKDASDKYKCMPIVNGKYVPSFYYFDHIFEDDKDASTRFLMVNSEITPENCKSWFNVNSNGKIVNIYTGWELQNDTTDTVQYYKADNFTPIYSMVYNILDDAKDKANVIVACHEMPFTVITNDNIATQATDSVQNKDRSLSGGKNSLVGSHLNRMSKFDVTATQWFSRLLEHFNVKLCIGGHKHTYSCTYPLRELYNYVDSTGTHKCSLDGKMEMGPTLEFDASTKFDNVTLYSDQEDTETVQYFTLYSTPPTGKRSMNVNLTKFPLIDCTKKEGSEKLGVKIVKGTAVYPYYACSSLTDGVTYFMLQATGYKLKSNKELPSTNQEFSYLLPKTKTGNKPDDNQQYPMFAEIVLSQTGSRDIYLYRINNILKDGTSHVFTQTEFGTAPCFYEYLVRKSGDDAYGTWQTTKQKLISL